MYNLHTNNGSEAERRLLGFANDGGLNNMPKPSLNDSVEIGEYKEWRKNTPGAQDLFDTFSDRTDVTIDDLGSYIAQKQTDDKTLLSFDLHLLNALNSMHKDNPVPEDGESEERFAQRLNEVTAQRIAAEQKLNEIVGYINDRNATMQKLQEERDGIGTKESLPPVTDAVVTTAKRTLNTVVEGFRNADGQEKVVMLAGAAAAILMIRYALKKWKGGPFLKGLGVAAGGLLTYMAFESMNKAVEKTTGVPIISNRNKNWIPELPLGGAIYSKEQLEEERKKGTLEKAMQELEGTGIPKGFIDQIGLDPQSKKFAIGINNVADMTVEEFTQLYYNHREEKRIPDDSGHYNDSSEGGDMLTSTERFAMVEDIGRTMGLIDAKGELITQPKHIEKQTMLYRMVDWDAPERKEEPPAEPEFAPPMM